MKSYFASIMAGASLLTFGMATIHYYRLTKPSVACIACLQFVIGAPKVIRDRSDHTELDSYFHFIRLSNGRYRGFTANQDTYAIDGDSPWRMGGVRYTFGSDERQKVLARGIPGEADACGNWGAGIKTIGGTLYGFFHQERDCNYGLNSQSHASWAIATSTDEGLTWSKPKTAIAGDDAPTSGAMSGNGCGNPVDAHDGWLYVYCLRTRDWTTIVARAPTNDPRPENWRKWDGHSWRDPAIGSSGAIIRGGGQMIGNAAAYLKHSKLIAVLGDNGPNGQGVWLSGDALNFTKLGEPLIPYDGFAWRRPESRELVAYIDLLNSEDGTEQIDGSGLLTYTYIPPDAAEPYLVMHDVRISNPAPGEPRVKLALSNWRGTREGIRTTSGPVIEIETWHHDAIVAYLMTAPSSHADSTRLDECVDDGVGHKPVYSIEREQGCLSRGMRRLRSAGWVYSNSGRSGTIGLYRCSPRNGLGAFASTDATCGGLGFRASLLGFALVTDQHP
jgi:hypothetical protein